MSVHVETALLARVRELLWIGTPASGKPRDSGTFRVTEFDGATQKWVAVEDFDDVGLAVDKVREVRETRNALCHIEFEGYVL